MSRSHSPQYHLTMKVRQLSSLLQCGLCTLTLAALPVSTVSAQASENLVDSIMSLRSDVEQLFGRLQDGRLDHRAAMQSLAAQKADLEAQINRQEISLQQLRVQDTKLSSDIQRAKSESASIKPALETGLITLREAFNNALPFKLEERLASLDELESSIQSGSLSEERALGQLWAAYEDFIRMTRENGVFKQEVTIDGEKTLADVAKVGMVMLFFRTSDGRFGYATREQNETVYRVSDNPVEQEQIAALFDAMEKQIRTGFFELPSHFVFNRESKVVIESAATTERSALSDASGSGPRSN